MLLQVVIFEYVCDLSITAGDGDGFWVCSSHKSAFGLKNAWDICNVLINCDFSCICYVLCFIVFYIEKCLGLGVEVRLGDQKCVNIVKSK